MKTSTILAIRFTFLFSILLFYSCKDDTVEPEICAPPINPYENCCETKPLEATLSIGKIYVPNIITANQDGFNDGVSIFGNFFIAKIDSLTISKNGQIIFEIQNLPSSPFNGPTWEGTDSLGNVVNGLVDVKFKATTISNLSGTFTTKVCVIPCGQEGFPIENLSNCGFSNQHNGLGEFTTDLHHHDDDCF